MSMRNYIDILDESPSDVRDIAREFVELKNRLIDFENSIKKRHYDHGLEDADFQFADEWKEKFNELVLELQEEAHWLD